MSDSIIAAAWIALLLAIGIALNIFAMVKSARAEPGDKYEISTRPASLWTKPAGHRVAPASAVASGRPSCCPPRAWCACWVSFQIYRECRRDLLAARAWLNVGRPALPGCINCIAILTRGKNGGHLGFVQGYDRGNPIIKSGNHNNAVGVGTYPASRVIAYRYI